MIVTCPSCSSKYRVRNEVVPADGARMRCPKCDTLFLAKPPTGPAAAQQSAQDDPSALYQQINPATHSGASALRPNIATTTGPQAMAPQAPMGAHSFPPTAQQPAPFGPPPTSPFGAPPASPFGAPAAPAPAPSSGLGKPQSGPITALFQAFDPGALPAEAQRPPQPAPQPPAPTDGGESPSGLTLDNMPKVRLTAPSSGNPSPSPMSTRPSAKVPAALRPPRTSLGATIGSWAALGAGALVAVFGVVFWAWTTETANLDGALMPMFEQSFGKKPPYSTVKHPEELDELRNAATAAEAAGDLPRAVVLWRRVQVLAPDDPRGAQHIAKNLTDLGDTEVTQ